MSDYSTTITVDFTPLSALATVTQSHTLHHGTTFASFDIDGTRTTVHFAADPDGTHAPPLHLLVPSLTDSPQTASARREP